MSAFLTELGVNVYASKSSPSPILCPPWLNVLPSISVDNVTDMPANNTQTSVHSHLPEGRITAAAHQRLQVHPSLHSCGYECRKNSHKITTDQIVMFTPCICHSVAFHLVLHRLNARYNNHHHCFTTIIHINLRQPAPPVKNWRILLVQSFTARMPLLTTTSTFGLGRRRWSFIYAAPYFGCQITKRNYKEN